VTTRFFKSQLDAAVRQLDCAIELWFQERDPVSIHTLAAAAHEVINDMHRVLVPDKDLLFDASFIKREQHRWIKDALRKPLNFFKHADRDPDPAALVEFSPFISLVFMLVCLEGLQNLGHQRSVPQNCLVFWMALHMPELMQPEVIKSLIDGFPRKNDLARVRNLSKPQQFKEMLAAAALVRK
jgi:hypothetical protein